MSAIGWGIAGVAVLLFAGLMVAALAPLFGSGLPGDGPKPPLRRSEDSTR